MYLLLGFLMALLGFLTGLLVMQALKSPYFLMGHFVNVFFKVYCLLLWYFCLRLIKEALQRRFGRRT